MIKWNEHENKLINNQQHLKFNFKAIWKISNDKKFILNEKNEIKKNKIEIPKNCIKKLCYDILLHIIKWK